MEKQSGSRTQDELQFLCDQMGDLPFFKDYIQEDMMDLLKRCVRFVQYKFYKKGDTIFHIDSKADKFYIIISGLVGVFTRSPDANSNKKRKKRNHEIQNQQDSPNGPIDEVQNNARQSITSLKGFSQKDLQQVPTEEMNRQTKNMSMISIFDDNQKEKDTNLKCLSQHSSMQSIQLNGSQQKRSLSPILQSNSQIPNLRSNNKQNTSSQLNETIQSRRHKKDKSIAFFETNVERSQTLDLQEKRERIAKSNTIILSPSKQTEQEGFFLTTQAEQASKMKSNTQRLDQKSKTHLNSTKQELLTKQSLTQIKDKDDISKKQSIVHFGENLTKAKEMDTGTAFGELALVYNKDRAASIVCLQDTHLAYIEKEQFIQIFSQKEERKIQVQAEYIGKLPLFSNFSFQFLRDLYYNTVSQKCKKGENIFLEGSAADYVYIVKKGEFGMFKQFKQTVNDIYTIKAHKKDSIESKSTNPLFYRKKIKKKEIMVMGVGENEVVGDSDLIEQRDRQFTLRCNSLEGELLVIKRDYFEEKIFKYQDTFNDLIKRCGNQQMIFDQRIESIKKQLEITFKSDVSSLYHKKERSFTNLTTDQQGIERRLPLSPTQEKNQYFDYHKKVQLHLNLQSKMEVSLPQIQTSFSPQVSQITQNQRTTTNQSILFSPKLKYFMPQTTRNEYENACISQYMHNNNNNNEKQQSSITNHSFNSDNKNISFQRRKYQTNNLNSKEETPERKDQYFKAPRNSSLISYSQQKRYSNNSSKNNYQQYEEELQPVNNYYEPVSNNFNLPNLRKNRDYLTPSNYRDMQISSNDIGNTSSVNQQTIILTPSNKNKTLESTLTTKRDARIQDFYKSNSNGEVNIESNVQISDRNFNRIFSTSKEEDKQQFCNQNDRHIYQNYRSISQQDVHTLQYDTQSTLPNGFYYNRQKKQSKRKNSKEQIPEISPQGDVKKIKKNDIPKLNLTEQGNQVKENKKILKKINKQNGSHTERISSTKNDNEKIFMDSTYDYFKKKEQAAKDILTERNSHKPLLMEIKQIDQGKNEQNRKKILSYHQQDMSQQEKILQTLIFQKKRIKKHLFSKIIGEELNLLHHQQLEQMQLQQIHQQYQAQISPTKGGGKDVINNNTLDQGIRKSQESNQYHYYYANNSFDQFQQNTNPSHIFKEENNPSVKEISPVSQRGRIGITSNNQQMNLVSTIQNKEQMQLEPNIAPLIVITDPEQSKISKIPFTSVLPDTQQKNEVFKQYHQQSQETQGKDIQIEKLPAEAHGISYQQIQQEQQRENLQNINSNNVNGYSVLKNNMNIFPEIRNFNLDSQNPIRDSQKYKIGSTSNQNRFFKKSKQKMQETRLKILQLAQETVVKDQ